MERESWSWTKSNDLFSFPILCGPVHLGLQMGHSMQDEPPDISREEKLSPQRRSGVRHFSIFLSAFILAIISAQSM